MQMVQDILIKPAGPDCNLVCTYCFYLKKKALFPESTRHRMSDDVLNFLIKGVMLDSGNPVSFGWQGGEPTLMGIKFFQKAIDCQIKYGRGQSVGNGLQTNGLLIDRDWAYFLEKYKFLVGLSLDGPKHIHNKYRLDHNGRGSWDKVVYSGKLLQDKGVAVNALTVVNDYSVQFPEEIYKFHKSGGFSYMQFIPCVETSPSDPEKAAYFSVSSIAYGKFLCKLFDLWRGDFKNGEPTTFIRLFDSLFYSYVGLVPPDCSLKQTCGNYVVVEHNGDVFSCDFFVEPKFKLGNVLHDNVSKMLNSKRQLYFGKLKRQLPEECQVCAWLPQCYGGCTKDRIRDKQDQGVNHFCSAVKTFLTHADPFYRRLADAWVQKQAAAAQNQSTMAHAAYPKIRRNSLCPCGSNKKFKKCCGTV